MIMATNRGEPIRETPAQNEPNLENALTVYCRAIYVEFWLKPGSGSEPNSRAWQPEPWTGRHNVEICCKAM